MAQSNKSPKLNKKRCRPLRVERSDCLIFVTTRVVEERYLLHPILANAMQAPNRAARRKVKHLEAHADRRIAALVRRANARRGPLAPKLDLEVAKRMARGNIGSALARAQEAHGVEVIAVSVMSNHVHLVLRTPQKNLAAFMRDFKKNVAGTINRLTGRSGPLWARRYDAQPILDDKAVAGRIAYALDNPVSANLVEHCEDWPGINMAFGFGDSDELEFEYLDCSAWHRANRPQDVARFFRTCTLRLSPAPGCEHMHRQAYRACVRKWMRDAVSERQANTSSPNNKPRPPLGIDKVIHTSHETRPQHPKFSRRPYAFGSRAAKAENFAMMSNIQAAHESVSGRFMHGNFNIEFPTGTYPPPIMLAAA